MATFEERLKRRTARKLSQSSAHHGKASIAKSKRKERDSGGSSKHKQKMNSLRTPQKVKIHFPEMTEKMQLLISKRKATKKWKYLKKIGK